jgi:uncharacterized protein YecE (DUF72 family)
VQGVAKQLSRPSRFRIGTSGWTCDDWRGSFYPREIPKRRWLAWYAAQFTCTEINGSFYRTPSIEAVQAWHDSTPANFRFAWKASKFITHWKRLSTASKNSIELLISRLVVLGPKCGPVLFQLPGRFEADRERLAQFLKMLPRAYDYAFEFRHASWYETPIIDLLRENDVSLCLSDHHLAPAPWTSTAQHVYVRGHGPTGRYKGKYPEATLSVWARKIRSWRKSGKTVYVFFDNDQKSAAPRDAARLNSLLSSASRAAI